MCVHGDLRPFIRGSCKPNISLKLNQNILYDKNLHNSMSSLSVLERIYRGL